MVILKTLHSHRATGMIYAATDTRDGRHVAIKEMQLNPQQMATLVQEMVVMRKAKHRCVVGFYNAYMVADKLWVLSPSHFVLTCNLTGLKIPLNGKAYYCQMKRVQYIALLIRTLMRLPTIIVVFLIIIIELSLVVQVSLVPRPHRRATGRHGTDEWRELDGHPGSVPEWCSHDGC